MSKKEKILEIHHRKKGRDDNSHSLANMLEATIHTGFHDPHKFIYEILQNADDARATDVIFHLGENYLLISYDGSVFKEEDVERICNVSTHNSADKGSKVHDINKVGYKGIGFKSVFCISEKVTVVSDDWEFCFNKSYWDQTEQLKEYTLFPKEHGIVIEDDKIYIEILEKGIEYTVNNPYGKEITAFIKMKTLDPKLNNLQTIEELQPYLSDIIKITADKGHTHFKTPWQIIPIVVNDGDLSKIPFIRDKAVNILLEQPIVPMNRISEELAKICQQHESILFLDNVKTVTFDNRGALLRLRKEKPIAKHGFQGCPI